MKKEKGGKKEREREKERKETKRKRNETKKELATHCTSSIKIRQHTTLFDFGDSRVGDTSNVFAVLSPEGDDIVFASRGNGNQSESGSLYGTQDQSFNVELSSNRYVSNHTSDLIMTEEWPEQYSVHEHLPISGKQCFNATLLKTLSLFRQISADSKAPLTDCEYQCFGSVPEYNQPWNTAFAIAKNSNGGYTCACTTAAQHVAPIADALCDHPCPAFFLYNLDQNITCGSETGDAINMYVFVMDRSFATALSGGWVRPHELAINLLNLLRSQPCRYLMRFGTATVSNFAATVPEINASAIMSQPFYLNHTNASRTGIKILSSGNLSTGASLQAIKY